MQGAISSSGPYSSSTKTVKVHSEVILHVWDLSVFFSTHNSNVITVASYIRLGTTRTSSPETGLNRFYFGECGRYPFLDSPLCLDQAHDITLVGGPLLPAPAATAAGVLVKMPYLCGMVQAVQRRHVCVLCLGTDYVPA